MVQDLVPDGQSYIQAKKVGRPTKLDDALIKRLASHIRQHNFPETAAAYENIPKQRFNDWLRNGKKLESTDPGSIYVKFRAAILKARAESQMELGKLLDKHQQNSWKPVAWRLEKLFDRDFGSKQRIEISGNPLESLSNIIEQSKKALEKQDKEKEDEEALNKENE